MNDTKLYGGQLAFWREQIIQVPLLGKYGSVKVLIGFIHNSKTFETGSSLKTKIIVSMDRDNKRAETKNVYYDLAEEGTSEDEVILKHMLRMEMTV